MNFPLFYSLHCAFLFLSCSALNLSAATLYDETLDGDLSGAFGSPTLLEINPGTFTIIGEMGANGNGGATNSSDADYFTFEIPVGVTVTSLTLDNYAPAGAIGFGSFLAYRSGTSFPGQGFGDIETWDVVNATNVDLLSALSLGPLTAGDHAFWFQETAPTTVGYTITATAVPEPSSAALVVGSLLLLACRRR